MCLSVCASARYVCAVCVVLAAILSPHTASALVNINTADAATLDTLPGIGATLAQRIIDYRIQNGPYETKEEIKNVNGIGDSTYNNLKDLIEVGDASTQTQSSTTTESAATSTAPSPPPVSTPVSSYVSPPIPSLYAHAGEDRVVIVGAHTAYEASAYDRNQEFVENVSFRWNFGDGTTAIGRSVTHHYTYPGRYIVVVSIAQGVESVSDTIIVTAEQAHLAVRSEGDGSVMIENRSQRDLDLSGWVVRATFREFVMPKDTMILAGETLRISPAVLGFFAGQDTELAYPNGARATVLNQTSAPSVPPATLQKTESNSAAEEVSLVARTEVPAPKREEVPHEESSVSTGAKASNETASSSQVAAAAAGSYWWFGAFGLATLTGGAAFALRRMRAKEWDIVEDSQ